MTQRWKIFASLAVLFLIGFFYRVSLAVTSRDLVVDLQLSAAQLGTLSGIFFFVFGLAQIPLGPLIDRFGSRMVICLSGIVTITGSLTFALATGYQTLLFGRGLLGLGTASILMGALKVYSSWFSEREFPRVSGYMIAAGNLGNIAATAPLAYAIDALSWRPTFLLITILQACAVVWVYLTVCDSPSGTEPHPPQIDLPGSDREARVLAVWKTLFSSLDFLARGTVAYFLCELHGTPVTVGWPLPNGSGRSGAIPNGHHPALHLVRFHQRLLASGQGN